MVSTVKEKKNEALVRMNLLKIHPKAIRAFKDNDILNYSLNGILYAIKEEWNTKIKEIEEEKDCIVYHAIFNTTECENRLTLLIVSNEKNTWEDEKENIVSERISPAYILNLNDDFSIKSEYVLLKPFYGGITLI